MTQASRKVEGGKMVEVHVNDDVRVLGDFFMHPEEKITGLEEVVSQSLGEGVDTVTDEVEGFLRDEDVDLLGVDARDIAEVAVEAHEKRDGKEKDGGGR